MLILYLTFKLLLYFNKLIIEFLYDFFLVNTDCPIVSFIRKTNPNFAATSSELSSESVAKRKLNEDEPSRPSKHVKSNDIYIEPELEPVENTPHYSFIVDLKINAEKMAKAELCGMHLAEKMKEQGADIIIRECKAQAMKS